MKSTYYPRILLFVLLYVLPSFAQEDDVFKDFQRILPRGEIPAILGPTYVTAKDADISDNTWILGIVINGQARAYSLNVLNHFEVVNDMIDSVAFAAVW